MALVGSAYSDDSVDGGSQCRCMFCNETSHRVSDYNNAVVNPDHVFGELDQALRRGREGQQRPIAR